VFYTNVVTKKTHLAMSFLPGRAACRRALLVAVDVLSD